MKTLVFLILLVVAVALYFGYQPYDLVTLFQPKPAAPVKHTRAPEPAPEATPQTWNATAVIASAPDGSLEHRWSPYPKASPTATAKR